MGAAACGLAGGMVGHLLAWERHERDGSWWAWVSWVQEAGSRRNHKVALVRASRDFSPSPDVPAACPACAAVCCGLSQLRLAIGHVGSALMVIEALTHPRHIKVGGRFYVAQFFDRETGHVLARPIPDVPLDPAATVLGHTANASPATAHA
jgi:hypothetical protein